MNADKIVFNDGLLIVLFNEQKEDVKLTERASCQHFAESCSSLLRLGECDVVVWRAFSVHRLLTVSILVTMQHRNQ